MTDLPPFDQTASGPHELSAELDAVLAQMGAVVLAAETVETTIGLVTALATATIPGTTGAGVTLVDGRGRRTLAASDPLVERADALQYQFDAGPCLTAWRDQVTVRVDDLAGETRWSEWSAEAANLGIRALLSVPLVAAGTSVGAIKVYSMQLEAYDGRAEHLLELFARQAAILLVNTQTLDDARQLSGQLRDALSDRDVIGQAKGVLIARGAADERAAFATLVAASQRSNVKVHQVARELMQSVEARPGRATTRPQG